MLRNHEGPAELRAKQLIEQLIQGCESDHESHPPSEVKGDKGI